MYICTYMCFNRVKNFKYIFLQSKFIIKLNQKDITEFRLQTRIFSWPYKAKLFLDFFFLSPSISLMGHSTLHVSDLLN